MKDAENFMNKNYRVALQYDPDGYWIAEHPELPGCISDGETAQEALSSLDISRELWIESRLATGLEVPGPQEAPQYSGRFVLRIPKSLHRDLANEAEAEGVSLNSLVSNVLASRHNRKEQSLSFLSQLANQNMGNVYPAFHMPENVKQNLSNLRAMPCRQQPPWQNQNIALGNEQMPEKELQRA
ncbi:MAG: type II toxin-antitoxin system HicB family antitoxin [Terracidiphilus sp.]